jgi:ferredoxin
MGDVYEPLTAETVKQWIRRDEPGFVQNFNWMRQEIGKTRKFDNSCLVCGNLFDKDRRPVIECRGLRVCSICRSRCSNEAIEFQKKTEEERERLRLLLEKESK